VTVEPTFTHGCMSEAGQMTLGPGAQQRGTEGDPPVETERAKTVSFIVARQWP